MTHDLIVIGAGPAGLSAATAAAQAGARVVVIDEAHRAGGRLLAELHEEGQSGQWWVGLREADRLAAAATAAGVEIRCGTAVWGLFPGWRVTVAGGGELEAPCILLATGATLKPLAVPGWTLPGVITAGAAQLLCNLYRVRPGKRAVIVGVDPLGLMAANHLAMAGVEVVGIVLPPRGPAISIRQSPAAVVEQLMRLSASAPAALLEVARELAQLGGPELAARLYPKKGMNVWGAPLLLRSGVTRILGESRVEGVELAELTVDGKVDGSKRTAVAVDAVVLAGGLAPLTELAVAVECEMAYMPELGGHAPLYGPDLETTRPGLFVAGSATGVEGATVAMAQGRLAGLAIARRLGLLPDAEAGRLLDAARGAVAATRSCAQIRFHEDIERGRHRMEALWADFQSVAAGR